jgi:hypothetical protein
MNDTRLLRRRKLLGTLGFYTGAIVLVIGLFLLAHYTNNLPYFTAVTARAPDDLTALYKAQDAYAATGGLLTTLATGLLAGLGLFLTSAPKRHTPPRALWPAKVSGLCVLLSLFFGFIASQNAPWAIENSVPVEAANLQLPRQLQFLALLASVIFFADFLRRDLPRAD